MEDQLKGPASAEAYANALQRGCKCVESVFFEEKEEKKSFNMEILYLFAFIIYSLNYLFVRLPQS